MNARISTGITGLDEILEGGLISRRAYVVAGGPGTGKTLLGLHFLAATPPDATSLFIGFTESEPQVKEDAESVGLSTKRFAILDLTASAEKFAEVQSYDIFSPAEVEREPITRAIRAKIEELNPSRIFLDGVSQIRMISTDLFHFIRIMQAFFRFVTARNSTVIVSTTEGVVDGEIAVQSLADGVIQLHRGDGRSLEVLKMRGGNFAPGSHRMRITSTGLEISGKAA